MRNKFNTHLHEDFRGILSVQEIDGVEYVVSFTKVGIYRAGDVHDGRQFSVVLKGELEITIRESDKDVKKKYGPHEFIEIPANIPHLYKAVTDCVFIQWLEGSYEQQYYEPYRKLVDSQEMEHEKSN